jgi:hypothetical protein
MRIYSNLSRALMVGCLAFAPHLATAGTFNGQVNGTFSAPVTSGTIVYPDGSGVFFNNSGSAVSTLCNAPCSIFPTLPQISAITWGNTDSSLGQSPSLVAFLGANLSNQPASTSFYLGSIIYTNFTSTLESLIFGANLQVNIAGVDPLNIKLSFVTTSNGGVDPAKDADFISFSGLGTNLSLAAFEGSTVLADLYGTIVGDPQLFLTDIQVVDTTAGFIGPAPEVTPIPATMPLFASGLGLLGFAAHRRKRKALST